MEPQRKPEPMEVGHCKNLLGISLTLDVNINGNCLDKELQNLQILHPMIFPIGLLLLLVDWGSHLKSKLLFLIPNQSRKNAIVGSDTRYSAHIVKIVGATCLGGLWAFEWAWQTFF